MNDDKLRIQTSVEFANNAMAHNKQVTEDELRKDQAFGEAYDIVNNFLNPVTEETVQPQVQQKSGQMKHGLRSQPKELSLEEKANAGMQLLSDTRNALFTVDEGLGLVGAYNKFKDAPKDVKEAMWYMWDKYEEADMTWSAFGRAMKSIGKDPSTYTGIGAGLKLFGTKAASKLAMNKFRNMLLSTTGAATAGAGYAGGEEFLRQTVADEYNPEAIKHNASIGAVVGVVAPYAIKGGTKVVGATGKKIGQWASEGEELMMQQAGGGTPPQMAEFKSVLETALAETSQKKWSVNQLKGYLEKQGVKTEEMKWSGIDDFLQGKNKVTTDEVLEAINQPELSKTTLDSGKAHIKELTLDYNDLDDEIINYLDAIESQDKLLVEKMMTEWNRELLTDGTYDKEWDYLLKKYPHLDHNMIHDVGDALKDEATDRNIKIGEDTTKYRDYATNIDGTNYREELTTMSPKINEYDKQIQEIDKRMNEIKQLSGGEGKEILDELKTEWKDLFAKKRQVVDEKWATKNDTAQTYSSSHWDESNVLYHVRKQDVDIEVPNPEYAKQKANISSNFDDYYELVDKGDYYKVKKGDTEFAASYSKERLKELNMDEAKLKEYLMNETELGKRSPGQEKLRSISKTKQDKTLLIEEIQSDWHQEGRKKGYKGANPLTKQEQDRLEELREYERDYLREFPISEKSELYKLEAKEKANKEGVPQAPYSKTWHEKAMKDQIQEAINNGYDRVAWVAGKEQADRYSLSKQIDGLYARQEKDGWITIKQTDKGGNSTHNMGTYPKEQLPDVIGKEMADKIIKDIDSGKVNFPKENANLYLGLDLEVGGEGMKGFYDKILPKFTEKYIKKYGAKLEIKKLPNGQEVWSFPITDKMKKEIKQKGQPLYQVGGATVAGGAAMSQGDNEQ